MEKKKDPTSSVKCYFVCLECSPLTSNKTIQEARSIFMHAHNLTSISRYMIRFVASRYPRCFLVKKSSSQVLLSAE